LNAGGEGCHVERPADLVAAADCGPFAALVAAVAVHPGDADQGAETALVELAELGQLADEGRGRHGTHIIRASILSVFACRPMDRMKSRTLPGLTITAGRPAARRARNTCCWYAPVASNAISSGLMTWSRFTISPRRDDPVQPAGRPLGAAEPQARDLDQIYAADSAARELPGYAGLWMRDLQPQVGDVQDMKKVVLIVAFTGDAASHAAALRKHWGGALCLVQRTRTESQLERIQHQADEFVGTLGLASKSSDYDETTGLLPRCRDHPQMRGVKREQTYASLLQCVMNEVGHRADLLAGEQLVILAETSDQRLQRRNGRLRAALLHDLALSIQQAPHTCL